MKLKEKMLPALLFPSVLMEDLHLSEWCPIEHSMDNAAFNCILRLQVDVTASWPSVKWVDSWCPGVEGCCMHQIGLVWTIDGSPARLR